MNRSVVGGLNLTMKKYVLIFYILISCNDKSSNRIVYLSAKKIDNYSDSKFYQDFNIFSRKGIEQLDEDTLKFPFFQMRNLNDSTIELTQFTAEMKYRFEIPIGDRITYSFHDIADGPRHVYTKIFSDKIVSYGYDNTLNEVKEAQADSIALENIVPSEIVIMKQDTVYSYYFGHCLDLSEIDIEESMVAVVDIDKYWIEPFNARFKKTCKDKVSFFDDAGVQKEYFDHIINEKKNPRIIGQREFQFWRQYYGSRY